MARFYLDECMSNRLQTELEKLGHDALHCRDLGYGKHPDYLQLLHAFRENRVLVTKDQTHFGELHGAWVSWAAEWNAAAAHAGILTVPDRMSNEQVAGHIHRLAVDSGHPMEARLYNLSLDGNWIEFRLRS